MADVGPRAVGRLGWVALAQAVRSAGYLAAVVVLVRRPSDSLNAAVCLVLADAMMEKFGGDSLDEALRNFESYRASNG